jgi:hypothetical protein
LCPLDQHDGLLLLRRIAVDAVKGLNLGRVRPIAGPAFVWKILYIHRSACTRGRGGSPNSHGAKQIASVEFWIELIVHIGPRWALGARRSFAAIVTKAARESAFIFRITLPRRAFTVISLMPSSNPTCFRGG